MFQSDATAAGRRLFSVGAGSEIRHKNAGRNLTSLTESSKPMRLPEPLPDSPLSPLASPDPWHR
jgi:hypothetical protein